LKLKEDYTKIIITALILVFSTPLAFTETNKNISLGEAGEELSDFCLSGKKEEVAKFISAAETAIINLRSLSQDLNHKDMKLALAEDLLGRARELCSRGPSISGALAANQLMLVALELEPQADIISERLVWFDYLAMDIILRAKSPNPYNLNLIERRAKSIVALWSVLRPGFSSHPELVSEGDSLSSQFNTPVKPEDRLYQASKAADFVDKLERVK
jgi:propanediol dehydratase small subunit